MAGKIIENVLVQQLISIAREAGSVILQIYEQDEKGIQTKDDQTPVTVADIQANAVIVRRLGELEAIYPVLSEESEHLPFEQRKHWHRYWLVDPLDGTNEFINRNGQFTINIALMEGQYPLFGMVYIPVSDTFYWGGSHHGAFRQAGRNEPESIHTRALNRGGQVITLGSRSYGNSQSDRFIEQLKEYYPGIEFERVGSALKGCRIAEGAADIYPRLGPTSEWDTAAVQAVVEGAGGLFLDTGGERFKYNFKDSLKNGHFLILGDKTAKWQQYWNEEVFKAVGVL